MKQIATTGRYQDNLMAQVNNNFTELYQVPSIGMQRFISKVRSYKLYKDETVRVSVWADSIWNNYISTFETLLSTIYPNKTFEFLHTQLGGTGSNYHMSMMHHVINWNPDLIIMAEWEGFGTQAEFAESIIKQIREKTSSDLVLVPWYVSGAAMDYLAAQDLASYKTNEAYQLRQWFYAMRAKYNCGMIDWTRELIYDLYNGNATTAEYSADGTHPTSLFFTEYATPAMRVQLGEFYENYIQGLQPQENISKTITLSDAIRCADTNDITLSGTWGVYTGTLDRTYSMIRSSSVGDYVEFVVNGIGFEISNYGQAVGTFDVLIDGVAPSTLLKDYATPANNSLVGTYKVIVDTNILSNSETEREFEIEMLSATTYKVTDITNATIVLASGDIASDEAFSVTGGQLTIPTNYCGTTNWRGSLATGQTYTFSVKKNWYDIISITNNATTNTTRLFGLERKNHTVRLTVASGEVNLDSIIELK